jgi:hypothetical protein
MPQVSIVVEETSDYWATWQHVFQGPNQTWLAFDVRQIIGNFFIGLQGQTANSWDTQIPPNSNIVSATMEFTPFATVPLTGFSATMNTPDRFGSDVQQQDPLQLPFDPFEGWRRDAWSNQEIAVVSTTFTFMAQPIGFDVGNRNWALRLLTVPGGTLSQNDLLAQRITPVPGNTTVLFISYQMRRFGNPIGDIIIHIQGVTFDRGVNIPDGVDILNGTSIPIAASTLSDTGLSGVVFFFTTNPVLVAGTDYFLVVEVEYAADLTNFIAVGHLNEFLSDGQLYHFGQGLGHDWQNYPGNVDLDFAISNELIVPFASADVDWPIEEVVIGVTETSPDISQLIQDQVSHANYTQDAGIIINLSRTSDPAQNRIMRSNLQVPGPGPILRITYGDPIVGADDETHDRFNNLTDQIHREDEELLMIGQGLVEICNRLH